jgi:hypothetical protein
LIAAFNQPNTKTMNQNINSEVLISVLTKQNKGLNNLVKMQQEQIDIYKKQPLPGCSPAVPDSV